MLQTVFPHKSTDDIQIVHYGDPSKCCLDLEESQKAFSLTSISATNMDSLTLISASSLALVGCAAPVSSATVPVNGVSSATSYYSSPEAGVEQSLVQSSTVIPTPFAASLGISSVPSIAPTSIASDLTPLSNQIWASVASTVPSQVISGSETSAASPDQGNCEGTSNACTGDVTHWDGGKSLSRLAACPHDHRGLGACGWNVDTSSQIEVALPSAFMGPQSNTNPYCGRALALLDPSTGITQQGIVGDKCTGCVDRAVDLTDALFQALVPTGDGRVHGIEWWFID